MQGRGRGDSATVGRGCGAGGWSCGGGVRWWCGGEMGGNRVAAEPWRCGVDATSRSAAPLANGRLLACKRFYSKALMAFSSRRGLVASPLARRLYYVSRRRRDTSPGEATRETRRRDRIRPRQETRPKEQVRPRERRDPEERAGDRSEPEAKEQGKGKRDRGERAGRREPGGESPEERARRREPGGEAGVEGRTWREDLEGGLGGRTWREDKGDRRPESGESAGAGERQGVAERRPEVGRSGRTSPPTQPLIERDPVYPLHRVASRADGALPLRPTASPVARCVGCAAWRALGCVVLRYAVGRITARPSAGRR